MRITPYGPSPELVSLRRRFLWLLIGVVGLFMAGMALSLKFSLQSNEDAEIRLLQLEARQVLSSVAMRWGDYRTLVDKLALDPEVMNLLRAGSPEDMQAWALSRQRLLPGIAGLALVNPRGDVFGDAKVLRVGPSCQRDLRLSVMQKNQQAVHRDMPGLELSTWLRWCVGRMGRNWERCLRACNSLNCSGWLMTRSRRDMRLQSSTRPAKPWSARVNCRKAHVKSACLFRCWAGVWSCSPPFIMSMRSVGGIFWRGC